MTLSIIATAGAVDANSYCTLAEAETYFEGRSHKTDWSAAITADKNIALVWATSVLDSVMNWYGWAMSETQALRWPRSGLSSPDGWTISSVDIPHFLKRATAEFAMHLIAADRLADSDTMGFKQIAVSSIQITTDKFDRKPVMPQAVWNLVRPYGSKYSGSSDISLIRG